MQGHDIDRTKNDARDYTCYCPQCDKPFYATRSDATFCSASCRVRWHREIKQFELKLLSLESFGRGLVTLAIRHKRSTRLFDVMQRLQKNLTAALAAFEIDE